MGSSLHTQRDAVVLGETVSASNLASPAGLEPATPGLGNRCYIRLGYGDAVAGRRDREQAGRGEGRARVAGCVVTAAAAIQIF